MADPTATALAARVLDTAAVLDAQSAELAKLAPEVAKLVVAPPPPPTAPYSVWTRPGYLRWGCSRTNNGDVQSRHEGTPPIRRVGMRRRFSSGWSSRNNLVNWCDEDLAVGRTPWVSTKVPTSGSNFVVPSPAEIDAWLRSLDAVGARHRAGILLTVNHEPENDGKTAATWRAVQRAVRESMRRVGTRWISFAPILMAHTWAPSSGRNLTDWITNPDTPPSTWDLIGVDYYVEDARITNIAEAKPTFEAARRTIGQLGLDMAIGEWGNRDFTDAAAAEMHAFYDYAIGSAVDGKGARIIGLCNFDSTSNGGWELTGAALTKFGQLLTFPTSVLAGQH